MRLAAVFDDELEEDEAFAGVAEVSAGFEVDAEFLFRFDEEEVAEAGGVGEGHAWGEFLPARVV
jgi:hypothetical protein